MKSDAEIRRNIVSELIWDPNLDHLGIDVRVSNGVVILTGEVTSLDDRWTAEEIAACVAGVRGIANEIRVKSLNSASGELGGDSWRESF